MIKQFLTKKRVVILVAIVMAIYFVNSYTDLKRGFKEGFNPKPNPVNASVLSNNAIADDYRLVNLFKNVMI